VSVTVLAAPLSAGETPAPGAAIIVASVVGCSTCTPTTSGGASGNSAEAGVTVDGQVQNRTVCVQADQIAATVASWLAELDAWSPFVELLGRAVRDGDWPAIHAIADYLSVEVQVAA
jgi:hypothetical protein